MKQQPRLLIRQHAANFVPNNIMQAWKSYEHMEFIKNHRDPNFAIAALCLFFASSSAHYDCSFPGMFYSHLDYYLTDNKISQVINREKVKRFTFLLTMQVLNTIKE